MAEQSPTTTIRETDAAELVRAKTGRVIGALTTLLADTGLEPSHLSQHLAVLRRHNLVVAQRRASQVFYRLAYPQVADLLRVARSLLVDILETTQQQLDSTVNLPEVGASGVAPR